MGADMESATLVEWHVKPGDRIRKGDIVAAVETSKGILDVESFQDGVVESLQAQVGDELPVGAVLAILSGATEPTAAAPSAPPPVPAMTPPSSAASAPAKAPPTRERISPAARRRAAELHVDPAALRGSGADGAITLQDVERAATKAAPRDMRSTIAAAMARSKREVPHYYLGTTIDLQRASDWLAVRNRERPLPERMLLAVLLLKAAALALEDHPEFNGHWLDGAFRPAPGIHLGVAIALRQGGLTAPALHDASRQPLDELMRRFNDLVLRARGGHLRAAELADATVTVTSLGERGAETLFPVIYAPQVAIIGFGKPVRRPVVADDGAIVAHLTVQATLAADHRVSDGHRGGLLLAAIDQRLQQPETL